MTSDDTCELLCLDAVKADSLRRRQPDPENLERAAEGAKALADPTRLGLAVALRDAADECCVCDLAFVIGRQDKLVSHHLRLLRGAGLAASRKDGRMVLYRLTERGEEMLESVLPRAGAGLLAR
ncbi:ArsR/SmtB family transcription factor [Miltoncostaea marina]|uniref:ArsR/SmtB family transcription factor n=1 Tax=Miltoncostaea marina TaxID=2843215 RepID=UPI001C3E4D88|nr:metalloregulator ArsR/SmtB family transcription factor [Miltoncostaea marina]